MAIAFDYNFYLEQKLAQLQGLEGYEDYTNTAQVVAAFEEAGLTVKEHYEQYGAGEGLNPSADFDTNAYLNAKLEQLQGLGGYEDIKTTDDVLEAFKEAGLSPLDHYNQYGINEGLTATPAGESTEELTGDLAAYEAAVEAQTEAEIAYSDAVVAAGLEADTDADDNGIADAFAPEANDYVLDAEQSLLTLRSQLSDDRRDETDAQLEQAVAQAQAAVNASTDRFDEDGNQLTALYADADGNVVASDGADGFELVTADNGSLAGYVQSADVPTTTGTVSATSVEDDLVAENYSARQLQDRATAAQSSLNANIASEGATLDLAADLEDAIVLYLANNSDVGSGALGTLDTAIDTLQTAAQTFENSTQDATAQGVYDTALDTFYAAVNTANDAVFTDTDGDGDVESTLESGARGDSVETLLTTLDERADLDTAADNTEDAFAKPNVGSEYNTEKAQLEAREELIADVAEAQASLAAVTQAAAAYEDAEQAVTEAGEELGFQIENIDTASEFGTDESDLFIFNADDVEGTTSIFVNGIESDDALFLGSGFTLGTEGSADNNVQEVFLTEVNGNAVLQLENTAFGSASEDFTEITLTGVAQSEVTIENGLVSIA